LPRNTPKTTYILNAIKEYNMECPNQSKDEDDYIPPFKP
jgi:hypothetical protein